MQWFFCLVAGMVRVPCAQEGLSVAFLYKKLLNIDHYIQFSFPAPWVFDHANAAARLAPPLLFS